MYTASFLRKGGVRYAGCRDADGETLRLLRDCIDEVSDKLIYRVCYRELP